MTRTLLRILCPALIAALAGFASSAPAEASPRKPSARLAHRPAPKKRKKPVARRTPEIRKRHSTLARKLTAKRTSPKMAKILRENQREKALVALDDSLDSFLNGQRSWNEKIMEFAMRVPEARLENESLHLPRRSVSRMPSDQVASMVTYHSRASRKYEEIIARYPASEREGARMAYPFAPIRVVLDP